MADPGTPNPCVVHLPRSLVALFPGAERRVLARGTTVLEVVRDVDRQVPGIANRVLDSGPAIRTHLNVFLDGERVAIDTPVRPGSEIHVIPAVSGG